VGALATFSALAIPCTSQAGGPGKWTNLADLDNGSATAGILRTADGDLHVAWLAKRAANSMLSYNASTISQSGKLLATGAAVSGWDSLEPDPRLVKDGSGIRLIFEGGTGTSGCDSIGLVYTATSADGSQWSPVTGSLSAHSAGIGNLAATSENDGLTPVAGFAGGHLFHVGVDSNCPAVSPDGVINSTLGSAPSNPEMATDQHDGSVWMGWYQNFAGQGYWVDQVLPSQAAPVEAPGSGSMAPQLNNQPLEPVALTARPGGGVYMAYCTATTSQACAHIDLWKVGTSSVKVVPGSRNVKAARLALAAGNLGRLWVGWFDETKNLIHAVRTNPTATSFGVVRSIKIPAHTFVVNSVQAEGSTGRLDVLLNGTLQTPSGFVTDLFHTQILAGFSLKAKPKRFSHNKSQKVTFTVTDAGQPVPGARVKCLGKKGKTSSRGKVKLAFHKGVSKGKHVCAASKVNYVGAKTTIKVT
jgi:hypothetical protein